MSRSDRLHFLLSTFNSKALNEIDRLNGSNTYDSILGIRTRFIPNCFKRKEKVLKLFLAVICYSNPLWNSFFLVKSFLSLIQNQKHVCYKGDKIFLMASIALPRVVNNANIVAEKDDKWLILPWGSTNEIEREKILTVFKLLHVKDIWSAYWDTIIVVYYYYFKKGYRYILPITRSFKWFLYNRAIRRIPVDVELVFANHKDVFAPMFDNLPHLKKTLVQHGTEILLENPKGIGAPYFNYCAQYNYWTHNMPFKYKHLSKLYCFTEKERVAMTLSVINCSPSVEYVGYSLKKLNENLEGEKAVLVVGYYALYYEREKKLISLLQDKGVIIYLKNHPVFPSSVYNQLSKDYDFVLLNGSRFPKVDVVFSYSSTLALEYEHLGAEIILYDSFDDMMLQETVDRVISQLGEVK